MAKRSKGTVTQAGKFGSPVHGLMRSEICSKHPVHSLAYTYRALAKRRLQAVVNQVQRFAIPSNVLNMAALRHYGPY
jgi:hypothetical protein